MSTSTRQDGIEYGVDAGIAIIAFDRPAHRNALDIPTRIEFAHRVTQAIDDSDVRAIVLTGRGGHFCAGGDIGSMRAGGGMTADAGRERMRKSLRAVSALYNCEKPVLAAVEGCAFGGGFGIALLADFIIAAESSRFCMSFARVGLVPDSGALYTLPRIVGVQRAKALMLTARELSAQDALALGIAMEITPRGGALERATLLAQGLVQASPVATAMTKIALNGSLTSDFQSMLEREAAAQGVAFSTDYHRQAVKRFFDKHPPLFQWPTLRS